MKLNRTGSNWNRLERNKINENWDIIEGSYNDVVGQITDEVVGHLIDSAKLIWKEPVDTVEDLPANAEVGETRMVREADPDGISYVYRYDGENWEKIQAIDVTLVNEVDRRLSSQLADTGQDLEDRGVNINKFKHLVVDDNWAPALEAAILFVNQKGGGIVFVPEGRFSLGTTEGLLIKENIHNVEIKGVGYKTIFDGSDLPHSALGIGLAPQKYIDVATLQDNPFKGDTVLKVSSSSSIEIGDIIEIKSDEIFNNQRPNAFTKNEIAEVVDVYSNQIKIKRGLYNSYNTADYNVTIDRIKPNINLKLTDFRVIMSGSGQEQQAFHVEGFKNLKVNGIFIEGAETRGLQISRGINATLEKSFVTGTDLYALGYGLYVFSSNDVLVVNNEGNGNSHSIEVGGCARDVTVANNKVTNDVRAGIATHGNTEFINILNNDVTKCASGILVRGRTNKIIGNNVKEIYGEGIFVGENPPEEYGNTGEAGKNNIIKDNHIINTDGFGLFILTSVYDSIISANSFLRTGRDGQDAIRIDGDTIKDTIISENLLDGHPLSRNGIDIRSKNVNKNTYTENVIIAKNIIKNHHHGLVYSGNRSNSADAILSDGIEITDNIIRNNRGRGISVDEGKFNYVLFNRNDVRNNGHANFVIGSSSFPNKNPVIVGNEDLFPKRYTRTTSGGGNSSITLPLALVNKPFVQITPEGDGVVYISGWETNSNGQYNRVLFSGRDLNGNPTAITFSVLMEW